MFAIAYLITTDAMRRHNFGARANDPVVPDRVPRRRRLSHARSERRAAVSRPSS